MQTRYLLHIDGEDYALREDDLRNWDAVKCSRTRSDYGGVVRSFTSQFEFVNIARKKLLALYLADGFNAGASVSVETQTNSWTYEKRFECHLDFSTIQWDDCVLRINAVDNSIAALIKANKSTKYEYAVGSDIKPDASVRYDRIPMIESATYEFTQGTTYDDCADIKVRFNRGQQPWVGNVGSETAINLAVYWSEDQEDTASGFLLRAERKVDIAFDYDLVWRTDESTVGSSTLGLRIRRDGELIPVSDADAGGFCVVRNEKLIKLPGTFASGDDLPSPDDITGDDRPYTWASVNGIVYKLEYKRGTVWEWENKGLPPERYFRDSKSGSLTFRMQPGDALVMVHTLGEPNNAGYIDIRFVKSLFTFSWQGIGDAVDVDAFTPDTVLNALLRSVTGRNDIKGEISTHDARLADTRIMAAESIRGLAGAKLYTSFNEFCDWMSAVFGYTYVIPSEKKTLGFEMVRECGGYSASPYSYVDSHVGMQVDADDIWYFPVHSRFLAKSPQNGNYYTLWPGHEDYNTAEGYARTDVLFRIKAFDPDVLCRFDTYTGNVRYPIPTDFTEDVLEREYDIVRFLHRSELFDAEAVQTIAEPSDVKYSVDSGSIYSSVTAGYDRKEYNSINGRDEFNFSNTYSTGCTVGDRTLSLISKYRADSYGIEFAAQARSKDTTDSSSDKDVFFIGCRRVNNVYYPDRTIAIGNSISGRLFNAAFCPMECVRANAGLIGLQSPVLTLAFASSTANSGIVIDDEPMSADITLDSPLATCGVVEFSTYEDITDAMEERIIKVRSGGLTYKGFLMSADTCYARKETAKCKLIVKEVSP